MSKKYRKAGLSDDIRGLLETRSCSVYELVDSINETGKYETVVKPSDIGSWLYFNEKTYECFGGKIHKRKKPLK